MEKGVVFDIGSGFTKCGFSGDNTPVSIFPTCVGRPKHPGIMVGMDAVDCFVGNEAMKKRGILKLKYPVEYGLVSNFNDFEKVINNGTRFQLKSDFERSFLMTERFDNPKKERERTVGMMFENFDVPLFYMASQGALSLMGSGIVSGLSVDFGHSSTKIVPIKDGYKVKDGGKLLKIGGGDSTYYLVKILCDKGFEMTTSAERMIVNEMKESLSYVALNYEYELDCSENFKDTFIYCDKPKKKYSYEVLNYFKHYETLFHVFPIELVNIVYEYHHFPIRQTYVLPDDSKIEIDSERFRNQEILFKPSFIGSEVSGVHKQCYDCVKESDKDFQDTLYQNIVVCGGGSQVDGIDKRLKKELILLAPLTKSKKINITSKKERKYLTWIGGSILSNLDSMRKKWISKNEYDEIGTDVINRKCLM